VVNLKRIAFLDLEQISVDFEIEHFETGSVVAGKNPDNIFDPEG